jgi:hypothetical protein
VGVAAGGVGTGNPAELAPLRGPYSPRTGDWQGNGLGCGGMKVVSDVAGKVAKYRQPVFMSLEGEWHQVLRYKVMHGGGHGKVGVRGVWVTFHDHARFFNDTEPVEFGIKDGWGTG